MNLSNYTVTVLFVTMVRVGGIGWLGDQAVTVVGIQKGKSLQDNLKRNFGQPHPEGYRKALSFDETG